MLRHGRTLLFALLCVSFVVQIPNAHASTEIGSRCTAASGAPTLLVQTVDPPGTSYAAPASGVITSWGTVLPAVTPLAMKLKVVRPAAAGSFLVVGESTVATAVTGTNTFSTRIPVAAGDRLGLFSALAAVYCAPTSAGELIGAPAMPVDAATGSTVLIGSAVNAHLALFATIEPDGDGDGYGDETQDQCPHSAIASTSPCPPVALSKFGFATRGSYQLLVTTSLTARTTVTGAARVPAYAGKPARTVRFKTQVKQPGPGTITRFRLNYPRAVKAALRRLPRSKKVRVTFRIQAQGLVNTASATQRATLRGRR